MTCIWVFVQQSHNFIALSVNAGGQGAITATKALGFSADPRLGHLFDGLLASPL
jgi:hypothetical protein